MTTQQLQLIPMPNYMLRLEHTTELKDVQQLVVDTYNYETSYNNGKWVGVRKEPIKVILKELQYSLDTDTKVFELETIVVLGFRKDKKVRAREDWVRKHGFGNEQYNDILPQIPDSFHDEARESFNKQMKFLIDDVILIEKNGVVVS